MNELSVLTLSCDRYADVWPAFFPLFWKNWPDCPYRVYLGTNQKQFNHPNVHILKVGPDAGWAESAQRMLEQIDSEYVLLLLEDFFLTRRVDSQKVASLFKALVDLDGAYLRLKPFPRPDHIEPARPDIGLIEPGAPYRVALQAAIWKKAVFLRLLKPGETPWQMELRGTVRSEQISEAFYSVWNPVLHYQAGITLGKWTPSALWLLQRENISPDLSARPVMMPVEALRRDCSRAAHRILNSVPWKLRRRIGNLLRKSGWLSPREA
jgi:hypothetical protein